MPEAPRIQLGPTGALVGPFSFFYPEGEGFYFMAAAKSAFEG